jgi:hypothetical protein
MPMAMFMTVAGRTTKPTVSAFTAILMELVTQETGKRINSMVKVLKLGLMEPATKDSTSKAESTAEVASHGLITAHTLATLSTTTSKEKVSFTKINKL